MPFDVHALGHVLRATCTMHGAVHAQDALRATDVTLYAGQAARHLCCASCTLQACMRPHALASRHALLVFLRLHAPASRHLPVT
eukprot:366453-Chlamydomonas_euryale.AAC.14